MSADNGIYILQTLDGYRVVHAQAIENIYEGEGFNLKVVAEYWGRSNLLKNEIEAWEEAQQLYDEIMDDDYCPIVEYGVQFINGMEHLQFPIHLIPEKENE